MGFNSSTTGGVGWLGGLQGAVVGMAVLLPIYWIKALGAGDVKLMGMIGAFLGTTDVLGVVLATFIVGGAMALVVAFCSRRLFVLLQNIKFMLLDSMVNIGIGHPPLMNDLPVSVGKLPYAVAISLGTFTYLIWQRL
jgi:prepilin peptidase CpaA